MFAATRFAGCNSGAVAKNYPLCQGSKSNFANDKCWIIFAVFEIQRTIANVYIRNVQIISTTQSRKTAICQTNYRDLAR